ncbi:unnamed protein product [Chrysoparadoxa australica]
MQTEARAFGSWQHHTTESILSAEADARAIAWRKELSRRRSLEGWRSMVRAAAQTSRGVLHWEKLLCRRWLRCLGVAAGLSKFVRKQKAGLKAKALVALEAERRDGLERESAAVATALHRSACRAIARWQRRVRHGQVEWTQALTAQDHYRGHALYTLYKRSFDLKQARQQDKERAIKGRLSHGIRGWQRFIGRVRTEQQRKLHYDQFHQNGQARWALAKWHQSTNRASSAAAAAKRFYTTLLRRWQLQAQAEKEKRALFTRVCLWQWRLLATSRVKAKEVAQVVTARKSQRRVQEAWLLWGTRQAYMAKLRSVEALGTRLHAALCIWHWRAAVQLAAATRSMAMKLGVKKDEMMGVAVLRAWKKQAGCGVAQREKVLLAQASIGRLRKLTALNKLEQKLVLRKASQLAEAYWHQRCLMQWQQRSQHHRMHAKGMKLRRLCHRKAQGLQALAWGRMRLWCVLCMALSHGDQALQRRAFTRWHSLRLAAIEEAKAAEAAIRQQLASEVLHAWRDLVANAHVIRDSLTSDRDLKNRSQRAHTLMLMMRGRLLLKRWRIISLQSKAEHQALVWKTKLGLARWRQRCTGRELFTTALGQHSSCGASILVPAHLPTPTHPIWGLGGVDETQGSIHNLSLSWCNTTWQHTELLTETAMSGFLRMAARKGLRALKFAVLERKASQQLTERRAALALQRWRCFHSAKDARKMLRWRLGAWLWWWHRTTTVSRASDAAVSMVRGRRCLKAWQHWRSEHTKAKIETHVSRVERRLLKRLVAAWRGQAKEQQHGRRRAGMMLKSLRNRTAASVLRRWHELGQERIFCRDVLLAWRRAAEQAKAPVLVLIGRLEQLLVRWAAAAVMKQWKAHVAEVKANREAFRVSLTGVRTRAYEPYLLRFVLQCWKESYRYRALADTSVYLQPVDILN